MKQLYAKILACGAIFGKNFGLRRYFWQKFWPAALFLTEIFDLYESAFFEKLLQEGYITCLGSPRFAFFRVRLVAGSQAS